VEQAVAGQAEEGWDPFVEIAREIGDSVLADRPKRRSGQLHPDKVAAVPDALLQVPARHGSGVQSRQQHETPVEAQLRARSLAQRIGDEVRPGMLAPWVRMATARGPDHFEQLRALPSQASIATTVLGGQGSRAHLLKVR
jgi:hypothetical protein